MITWGFSCGYSGQAVLDTLFPFPSCYLYVATGGNLVFENSAGAPQYFPGTQNNGLYPLAARRILTSAVIDGVTRTTTATGVLYLATGIP